MRSFYLGCSPHLVSQETDVSGSPLTWMREAARLERNTSDEGMGGETGALTKVGPPPSAVNLAGIPGGVG